MMDRLMVGLGGSCSFFALNPVVLVDDFFAYYLFLFFELDLCIDQG